MGLHPCVTSWCQTLVPIDQARCRRHKRKKYGWPRLRAAVLQRDHHTCVYCGDPADTVDHVLPVSKGGLNTLENCVAACDACNCRKGDRTFPWAAAAS